MIKSPKSLSDSNENLFICKRELLNQTVASIFPTKMVGNSKVLFYISAFLLFFSTLKAQTTLIPTTQGGFEAGTTLAANGWSATTSAFLADTQWTIGTATTAVFAGTRAAYVTNNSSATPPPHAYNFTGIGNPRVSHLYRNITVPAGQNNIVLSFRWICAGEGANDKMRIYLAPSNHAPAYNTATGVNTTAIPNGLRGIGGDFSGQATWTTSTLSIPEGYAGTTFMLIFEWTNNANNTGTNPPIAVDNVTVTSSTLAVPANDLCANAPLLTVNQGTTCTATTNGTSVGATASAPAACAGNVDDDVWYRFVATQASHTITVTPTTMVDAAFQVFSGSCSVLSSIGCYNVTTGVAAETGTLTGLVNGTTYYVRVHSVGLGEGQGTFNICVTSPAITYCTPATTTAANTFINNFRFLGTLNDVSNLNSSSGAAGYQNFTALPKSIQAQGEGMNVYVENNANTVARVKAWVDWNKDGDFDDAGETVYNSNIGIISTTFGFIVPATVSPGDYRIRVRNFREHNTTNNNYNFSLNFTPCEAFTNSGNTNRYGEAEDYAFTVVASCSATITSVTNGETCGNGPVTLSVTGAPGITEYRWYADATGGSPLATTTTGTWTTPSISTTTIYYVTAFNGCESLVRTAITATRSPLPDVTFTPAAPVVCGENSIISLSVAGDIDQVNLVNENFENGLGVFTNVVYNSTTYDAATSWQSRTSTFIPTGQVWFPAVSSGLGTNKFVMATSDVGSATINNGLVSPVVNSTGFVDLTLTFKMYYSHYRADNTDVTNDYVTIDVSVDGGSTWTEIIKYTADIGIGTKFQDMSVSLASYINRTNLRFRIRYYGVFRDGVAVDTIRLYGNKPLNTAFQFVSASPLAVFADPSATTPYNSATMTATTVYIKPTLTQLENATFTITANAVLANGCTTSKNVVVTNNTRIWRAPGNSIWNTATNWKPAATPTANNCVIIIDNTTISGSNYEAYGRNLNVKSTGVLTVNPSNTLTITEAVRVDNGGVLTLENTGSLVQINNSANTGNIKVKANTKPVKRYDYTYWSSPVSPMQLLNVSPTTLFDKFYSWNVATQSWLMHISGNVSMATAKGYIVRAPQTYQIDTPSVYSTEFNGVPNNGNVSINVVGNPSPLVANYQWNLIGNPYPSAISANSFLSNANNVGTIGGTIYLWTHNTKPSRSIPGTGVINYSPYDYATYNLSGGVGVSATDDPNEPIPSDNVNYSIPTGYIASGQAFFVRGLSNGTAQFTNAMRVKGLNNQFYRNVAAENDSLQQTPARERFWLNMTDNQGAFNQMMVGYIHGATDQLDRSYDGELFRHAGLSFYSVNTDMRLTIQARSYPFNPTDVVALGYQSDTPRTLYISMDHVDEGVFENQDIFIKDNLLGTLHNLKIAPYSFATASGTFHDRLEIVYGSPNLGIGNTEFDPESIIVFKKQQTIVVNAGKQIIDNLKVVDLQGRVIYDQDDVDANEFVIKNLPDTNQVLIVQVFTDNGSQAAKKIIY